MRPALDHHVAEFTDYLDQTRLDTTLLRLHKLRLVAGLAGCLTALIYNLYISFAPNVAESALHHQLMLMLSSVYLLMSTVMLIYSQRTGIIDLARQTNSVTGRAALMTVFLSRRGLVILALAVAGQVVVVIATWWSLSLFLSIHGAILLVNLLPTVALVIYSIREMPTRDKLVNMYRSMAILQARMELAAAASANKQPQTS